jgi:hypothetical protein
VRVLLARAGSFGGFVFTRDALVTSAGPLAGQRVTLAFDGTAVGSVLRAWVDGDELWADVSVDRAALPHEMNLLGLGALSLLGLGALSLHGVKQ